MKKIAVLVLAALALMALSASMTFAAGDTVTVQMNAQNGSGEDGTATITKVGDNDIKVVFNLKNAPADAQPAHIHKGTCANLDPKPLYPLNNAVNGSSDTTVMTSMADLENGTYAVNVHKSATDIKTYVSCGDIHAAMMAGNEKGGAAMGAGSMPGTGNGDFPITLAALAVIALGITGVGLKLAHRKA